MRAAVASKGAPKPRLPSPPISTPTERWLKAQACQGLVCKVNHLRRFVPILANDQVRRDIWSADRESFDGAFIAALAIVQHYEVNARAATVREIGGRLPEKRGKKVRQRKVRVENWNSALRPCAQISA